MGDISKNDLPDGQFLALMQRIAAGEKPDHADMVRGMLELAAALDFERQQSANLRAKLIRHELALALTRPKLHTYRRRAKMGSSGPGRPKKRSAKQLDNIVLLVEEVLKAHPDATKKEVLQTLISIQHQEGGKSRDAANRAAESQVVALTKAIDRHKKTRSDGT